MIEAEQSVIDEVERWLDEIVIGMGICPFAATPRAQSAVGFRVCSATDEVAILEFVDSCCRQLLNTEASELETTLVIAPKAFKAFDDYNQFLDTVDALITKGGYEGLLQVASFHPQYQFADAHTDDQSNLTNCSPYPIFHLIREASLTLVLKSYPNPESIPLRNVRLMESLSKQQVRLLFPYWRQG